MNSGAPNETSNWNIVTIYFCRVWHSKKANLNKLIQRSSYDTLFLQNTVICYPLAISIFTLTMIPCFIRFLYPEMVSMLFSCHFNHTLFKIYWILHSVRYLLYSLLFSVLNNISYVKIHNNGHKMYSSTVKCRRKISLQHIAEGRPLLQNEEQYFRSKTTQQTSTFSAIISMNRTCLFLNTLTQ